MCRWRRDNLVMINDMNDIEEIISTALFQIVTSCTSCWFSVDYTRSFGNRRSEGKLTPISFLYCWLKLQVQCHLWPNRTKNGTWRGHLLRATLGAVCYQIRNILEANIMDRGLLLVQLQIAAATTIGSRRKWLS